MKTTQLLPSSPPDPLYGDAPSGVPGAPSGLDAQVVALPPDLPPGAPVEASGDAPSGKVSRASTYITLAVFALLVLAALANRWRMRAFERHAAISAQNLPALTHEFRYHLPDADTVFLVWGIDGWNPVPDSLRPAGTQIENGVMHSPMDRDGDVFVVKIQAPANTTVYYGFLITADQTEKPIPEIWDGIPNYHLFSVLNRTLDIEPSVTLKRE